MPVDREGGASDSRRPIELEIGSVPTAEREATAGGGAELTSCRSALVEEASVTVEDAGRTTAEWALWSPSDSSACCAGGAPPAAQAQAQAQGSHCSATAVTSAQTGPWIAILCEEELENIVAGAEGLDSALRSCQPTSESAPVSAASRGTNGTGRLPFKLHQKKRDGF